MKANGAYTALVSGGFTAFSVPVGDFLGFDKSSTQTYYAKKMGIFTGQVIDPIFGKNEKSKPIKEFGKR